MEEAFANVGFYLSLHDSNELSGFEHVMVCIGNEPPPTDNWVRVGPHCQWLRHCDWQVINHTVLDTAKQKKATFHLSAVHYLFS